MRHSENGARAMKGMSTSTCRACRKAKLCVYACACVSLSVRVRVFVRVCLWLCVFVGCVWLWVSVSVYAIQNVASAMKGRSTNRWRACRKDKETGRVAGLQRQTDTHRERVIVREREREREREKGRERVRE